MKSDLVQQITLYKYRYIAGFGVLLIFILATTTWQFWTLPNGLTEAEMVAATSAGHFSLSQIFSQVVNLPWTVLEWLSIKVFGASTFAFRLPAVILMIFSAGGLVLLLKKWSRNNIAVISGFLVVTSVFFMSLARAGTPAAMTTFLITTILLSALTIIRSVEQFGGDNEKNKMRRSWQAFLAKIVLCVAVSLLCYQAAGAYLVVMFIAMGILHPKTRLIFIKSTPWKIIVGTLAGLVVMAPLIIGLITGGWVAIKEWLALDGAWSLENLRTSVSGLIGFDASLSGGLVTPLVSVVVLIIIILGLMRVMTNIFSARSYLVLPLLVATLTLAIWQPNLLYLLFVPLALLTTVGIETLVREWYNLFPRNPYARLLAVLTLAILITGLVWTQLTRFGLSQNYSTDVVYSYNQEYQAVREVLLQEKSATALVAKPDQQKFYQILQRDFPGLTVATTPEKDSRNIVLGSAGIQIKDAPIKIVTSPRSKNAVLLRIY